MDVRFEYSEQRDVITRENPLSYHNLGLAVQSSFIEPAPLDRKELPWRPQRKGSDLPDVHLGHKDIRIPQKLALDKLSGRIHRIWNKMENATRKSIDNGNATQSSRQKASIFRRLDSSLSEDSLGISTKTDSVGAANKRSQSSSKSSLKNPSKVSTNKRTAASSLPNIIVDRRRYAGAPMVYHSHPVPEPDVLPITRINPSEKFPRISSVWNSTDQEAMEPTTQLVNQMNVAKETNLLVYKSKEKIRSNLLTASSSAAAAERTESRRQYLKQDTNPASTSDNNIDTVINCKRELKTICLDKQSLKWKRVLDILDKLQHGRVEERRDAAMHLGSLECSDSNVVAALTQALQNDTDRKVIYEAAKSLISLGVWSDQTLQVIIKYLQDGSYEVRLDLVNALINGRDIQLVSKDNPNTKQLIAVLRKICVSGVSGDDLGYDCAVCLGCLGVADPTAENKLRGSFASRDSNVIYRSLEILVRLMHVQEPDVIKMVLNQMQFSKVWKHRLAAARLLVLIGCKYIEDAGIPSAFSILEKRLYDDPSRDVRNEIAKTLTALNFRDRVTDLVEKRLGDDNDEPRASAVMAVGVLGMKSDKIIRTLLEMLELDSCDYVRLQIIRTFGSLGLTSIKILRALRERERSEGPLAREAAKALRILKSPSHVFRCASKSSLE